jgi:hypothetical protein
MVETYQGGCHCGACGSGCRPTCHESHPDRVSVNARCLEGVDTTALQPRSSTGKTRKRRRWRAALPKVGRAALYALPID